MTRRILNNIALITDRFDPVVNGLIELYNIISSKYDIDFHIIKICSWKSLSEVRDFSINLDFDVIHVYLDHRDSMKLLLMLTLYGGPKLLVFTERSWSRGRLSNLALSILLSILKTKGVKVLLFYPTSYERYVIRKIMGSIESYHIDTYMVSEKPSLPLEFLSTEPLVLLMPLYFDIDKNDMKYLIDTLRGIGLNVKAVLIGSKCIKTPYTLCIHSDSYSNYIRQVSLGIALKGDPFSNKNILELISYGKPVIAYKDSSIAYTLLNSGLVYIIDKIDPDTIATEIINVINRLDIHKKILVNFTPPIKDYEELADRLYRTLLKSFI